MGLALTVMVVLAGAGTSAAHPGDGSGGGLFWRVTESSQGGGQGLVDAAGTPPTTPRPVCGPGSRPETGMQGRVQEGQADAGFTCNTTLLSRHGKAGGFKVLRFVDKAGHECAYYDSTLLFPSNAQFLSAERTGVTVLDMADPAKPVQTASLTTPAMQSPHESVLLNEKRGLLVAVMGNPLFAPGVVDVYDLNEDCRKPALQSSLPVGLLGHESGFAPDGNTFYATSLGTGQVTAVDLSDPKLPKTLAVAEYNSHGFTVSDDGNRGYIAASSGLIIVDLSDIQGRRPNPEMREISRLTWDTLTIPQVAHPVTIDGKPYLVEIDEYSDNGEGSSVVANGSRVGAARIIDISDETKPKVVSDIRMAVHQPENRAEIGGDPGADNALQGYAGHYCSVPRRKDPGIVACSFIASGLRVFDIRDPEQPKEVAYFVAPVGPSSTAGRPSNYAMSSPAFATERGEIWYSDGNTGFYALRVAERVWPFKGAGTGKGKCLARRSPIGPRNVGRVRLGYTRKRALLRIGPQPVQRRGFVYRWCVRRSGGRVTSVFSGRGARGRVRLVLSTSPRHRMRTVGRGASLARLLRRFPKARRAGTGIYRTGPRTPRIFGVRAGKVRFVGVADRGLLRNRRALRTYIRRAGG